MSAAGRWFPVSFLLFAFLLADSIDAATWIRRYSSAQQMVGTADGGYVVVSSAGANPGFALEKLDATGTVLWVRGYEGGTNPYPSWLLSTSDGGYLVAGGGQHTGFLLKVDVAGDILWGVSLSEDVDRIVEGPGGELVLAGGLSPSVSDRSAWVVVLDRDGSLLWQKRYGYDRQLQSLALALAPAGGYFLAMTDTGSDFPPTVVRIGASGDLLWSLSYTLTGQRDVFLRDAVATADGGLILSGAATAIIPCTLRWLLKLDAAGAVVWALADGTSACPMMPWGSLGTADGGVLFWSSDPSGPGNRVERFAASGDLIWSGSDSALAGQTVIYVRIVPVTGGITMTTSELTQSWVIRTDVYGRTSCSQDEPASFGSIAVTSRPYPVAELAATLTLSPLAFTEVPANSDGVTECASPGCASPPAEVRELRAVRGAAQPAPDPDSVFLSWLADPNAPGYNVWYVTSAAEIPQARYGFAQARLVPSAQTEARDQGAVSRAPSLFFYQVRAACDADVEGP